MHAKKKKNRQSKGKRAKNSIEAKIFLLTIVFLSQTLRHHHTMSTPRQLEGEREIEREQAIRGGDSDYKQMCKITR